MMNVLISDCDYKHSIAIQRYVRRAMPEVNLTGYSREPARLAHFYGYCHRYTSGPSIAEAATRCGAHMVIPVGGQSVRAVAADCPQLAVLPAHDALEVSYDKARSTELASALGVSVPRTIRLDSTAPLSLPADWPFPCVVKPASELDAKFVWYVDDPAGLSNILPTAMAQLPPNSRGLLVQERVAGFGAGFFALYDRGRLIRTFMHHRIREWPLSGGPSTAARAVRDGAMFDAGKRILDALQWNGPAMVEFKYRSDAGTYTFIEVNGKFWGSVELALSSGVNFAADLVKLHRGDGMSEDHSYDAAREFYWPLDGDILALLGGRRLAGVREYFRPQARTNLGQSITAESLKLGRLVWQLLRRIRGGGG